MNVKQLIFFTVAGGLSLSAVKAADALTEDRTDDVLLTRQDVAQDAQHSFEEVDTDRNGVIDIDEYAAQAYVQAELARLNRYVTVESNEAMRIALPSYAPESVTLQERSRISAIARRQYYEFAGADAEIDPGEWAMASQAAFSKADRNDDGRLRRDELTIYANDIAAVRSSGA